MEKSKPRLLKLCPTLKENLSRQKASLSNKLYLSLNAQTIVNLIREGKAPAVSRFSLESVCETDRSYEEGGFNTDLKIGLPGKPTLSLNLKESVQLVDDRTLT